MLFITRVLLCLLLTTSFSDAWPVRGSQILNNGGGVVLNLDQPTRNGAANPLLNWWQVGDTITLVSTVNGTLVGRAIWDCPTACSTPTTYFDAATGELISPLPADVTSISRQFFATVFDPTTQYAGIANPFLNQVWDVAWQGCATPTVTAPGSGFTSSFGSNSGTVTFGPTAVTSASLTFTFTGVPACYLDPPRNIWVSQQQYAAEVAACTAGTRTRCFNPDWLNAVRQFGVLRFMDFMQTNNSGISDISQLADFNFNSLGQLYPGSWISGGSISGTVFTASGSTIVSGLAPLRVGSVLYAPGVTPGAVTITSFGTGTGFDGTYNISCAGGCPTVGASNFVAKAPVGANFTRGPKGGMHPNIACALGQATGAVIEYPIPVFSPDQTVTDIMTVARDCAGVRWKWSLSNELFNFGANFRVQYDYANAQTPLTGLAWGGYREAQIFEIAATVFGTTGYDPVTNPTSRWWGSLGSFFVTPSVTATVISGANAWISGGSSYTLQQLVRFVDVAPYFGQFNITGPTITGVTVSATPRVTTSSAHNFTNGQAIKLFVSGGTMASVLNNVFTTATVINSTQFDIGISTVGLTYADPVGGGTNYAMDATLFKMADESIALNGSTPGTYPTKYSYFAQQFSKSILTGSASDPSYGTFVTDANGNFSNTADSVQGLLRQHALIANTNGLGIGQYEGMSGAVLAAAVWFPEPPQLPDFLSNYQFDTGVIGDSTNNITNLYASAFQAMRDINASYPSQFNDRSPQSKFGPWGSLRAIPSDIGNPKWQAVATENALGPYTPVYPPAPGSYSYLAPTVANANQSTQATTYSFDVNVGTAATYISVCFVSQSGAATLSGLTVGGQSLSLTADAINTSTGITAIYSGAVPSGAATRTVTLTYGSSAFNTKAAFVYGLSGLANNSVDQSSNGAGTTTVVVNETKDSAVIGCGHYFGGTPNWGAGASNILTPVVQNNATVRGSSSLFKFSFSSQIMNLFLGSGTSGVTVAASYR